MILSAMVIMPIEEGNIPICPMFGSVCAAALGGLVTTDELCTITLAVDQYFGKNSQSDFEVQLIHSQNDERLLKQTKSVQRGSCIFAGGDIYQIEDRIYIEVKEFSFVNRGSSSPGR